MVGFEIGAVMLCIACVYIHTPRTNYINTYIKNPCTYIYTTTHLDEHVDQVEFAHLGARLEPTQPTGLPQLVMCVYYMCCVLWIGWGVGDLVVWRHNHPRNESITPTNPKTTHLIHVQVVKRRLGVPPLVVLPPPLLRWHELIPILLHPVRCRC